MKKIGIFLLVILFGLAACAKSEQVKKEKKKKEKITKVETIKKEEPQKQSEEIEEEINEEAYMYPDSSYWSKVAQKSILNQMKLYC